MRARLQFYGPAKTSMSPLVARWVDAYVNSIELDFAERPYLFHVQSDMERCVSSSQWTNIVKARGPLVPAMHLFCAPHDARARLLQAAFAKYSPNKTQTPPKLLRASFITHLRGSDTAPEVLSSAAAAMKHLVRARSTPQLPRTR